MPDFYDYDMIVGTDGEERYFLRRNTRPLGLDKFCKIEVRAGNSFIRITQWGSKPGRRYAWFDNLSDAMSSGTDWAIRRSKEDAR